MNKDLQDRLFNAFPKMFPPGQGGLISGSDVECGNGWFPLIYNLCACIQRYTDDNQTLNPEISQVVVSQIKEKFGTLRFYCQGGDDTIEGMIWFACFLSGTICEETGAPGQLYVKNGWYRTLSAEVADREGFGKPKPRSDS